MNELPSARRHLTLHARTRGPGDGTVQLRLSGAAQIERRLWHPKAHACAGIGQAVHSWQADGPCDESREAEHRHRLPCARPHVTGSAWLPSRLGGDRQKRAARGLHPLLQPAHPRRHLCTTTHSRCPRSQPPLQSLQFGSSATRHNCRKRTAPYRPAVFAHHPRELPAEKLPTASETTTHAKEVCRKPRKASDCAPPAFPRSK
jgi:hypothetical protein